MTQFAFAEPPNKHIDKFTVGPTKMHPQTNGIDAWNEECKLDGKAQKMRRAAEKEFTKLYGGDTNMVGKSIDDGHGLHIVRAQCATFMAEILVGSIIRRISDTNVAIPNSCTFANTVIKRAKSVGVSTIWQPNIAWGEHMVTDEGAGKEIIEGVGNSRWHAVVLLSNLTSRGERDQLIDLVIEANKQAEQPADVFIDAVSDDAYRLAALKYLQDTTTGSISGIFTGIQKFMGGGTEGSAAVVTNEYVTRILKLKNGVDHEAGIVSVEAQYKDSVKNMPSYTPDLRMDAWIGEVCQMLNNPSFQGNYISTRDKMWAVMNARMREGGDMYDAGISLPVPIEYASSVTPLIKLDGITATQALSYLRKHNLSASRLPPSSMDDRLTNIQEIYLRTAFFSPHASISYRFENMLDALHECAQQAT